MKCKRCNIEVKGGWRFCPICGTSIAEAVTAPLRFNFSEGINLEEDDFDEVFKQAFQEVDKMFKSIGMPGNINITVKTNRPGPAQVRQPVQSKKTVQQQRVVQLPQRIVKSAEEPEMKMENAPNYISIELKVPGVASVKDIFIKKLNESIEVRAYAGDKMYFKVIPINPGADVAEKKFVSGILSIKLQK